ncbi:MAG: hypothetical protein RR012_01315 [Oscillospiraceae bacterium]
MKMKLITIAGKQFTRIKINKKLWNRGYLKKCFEGSTPSKESSKFIYFEVEGDLLNTQKEQ